MKSSICLFTAVLLLGASASHAGCEFTEAPPAIPEGATATEADMLATQSAIKIYIEHSTEFMECLDQEGRQAGDADTAETKAARDARHNEAVDSQQALADDFNAQIRAWKAQSAE